MSGGRISGGYTIVEVMMFLAISGALFVIAMFAIGGKQAQAQFAQGIRDFQSRIDDITNDVSTGYFPQPGSYSCTAPDQTTGAAVSFAAGTAVQGENEDCIFVGKVLHFTQDSRSVSLLTVGGRRATREGLPVSTLAQAKPLTIDGSPTCGSPCPNMTETFTIDGGLIVRDIISRVGTNPISHPAAVAIFSSLPQQSNGATSGSLTTNTVTIPSSQMAVDDVVATASKVNNMTTAASPPEFNPVTVICLQHGAGGKKAALVMGARGRQPYAEVHVDDADVVVSTTMGVTCP